MSLHLIPATPGRLKTLRFSGKKAAALVRLILSGPRQLVTSGLTTKSAALMILLSIPALLVTIMITLPGMLFSEQQNEAYAFGALNLNRELSNSMLLLTTVAVLSVVSLMVPALGEEQFADVER